MKRFARAIEATCLITGITVVLGLAVAGGFWLWAKWATPEVVIDHQNQTFAYHPWAGFRNTPGYDYSVGNMHFVKINKYGWRGPEPALDRPKNVKRAILLGDSVAFSGWGCREGVTLGGALTRALELRTGEEWEVINMAVPGAFSSVSLATLAHEGMRFKPDVVMTLNGGNDLLIVQSGTWWMYLDQPRHFPGVLYHAMQNQIANLYDPRTGQKPDPKIAANDPTITTADPLHPSSKWLKRLDPYIDSELTMSYLVAGSGAIFIAFLQPYLSLEHKVVGDKDREVIEIVKGRSPGLLEWLDVVYPALREKLTAAAAKHPTLNFVDLSLMFTDEQVFEDNAHVRCETNRLTMPGNEIMAARMSDEIVARLYRGKQLPDWRRTHIEGTPHDWNDQAYLDANPDIAPLVAKGEFPNGYAHYVSAGFMQGRDGGFPRWSEKQYLTDNPDVAAAVEGGRFASGFDHYLKVGRAEGRLKGLRPRWVEESYLRRHGDVREAIARGEFKSGLEHYRKLGAKEGRGGGFSGWDEEGYLFAHGDVRYAVETGMFKSGLQHYYLAGAAEGRPVRLGTYTPRE
jgi:hypothetical protein